MTYLSDKSVDAYTLQSADILHPMLVVLPPTVFDLLLTHSCPLHERCGPSEDAYGVFQTLCSLLYQYDWLMVMASSKHPLQEDL